MAGDLRLDKRFAMLTADGAGLTGAVILAATAQDLPGGWNLAMVALIFAGGTLLRMLLPAALLWLFLGGIVRRGWMPPRIAATLGAALLGLAGWLVCVDLAQDMLGPRIRATSAPVAALAAMIILPILSLIIYRNARRP